MTPTRIDDELDAMLAAARPADPARDRAVAAELDAMVARTVPRARGVRGRRLLAGAGAGALLLGGFGAGAAMAEGGATDDAPSDVTRAADDTVPLTVVDGDSGCTLAVIVQGEVVEGGDDPSNQVVVEVDEATGNLRVTVFASDEGTSC
ncbi:hypothetical protein [Protaetiibacter intestinalis]|uniref:Uncharacterized protein n=1 Tax=Protaetiibacter intestinalis TaxID=2419774 RepID=A0A387BB82_9MICO|nr:hypothetical protein [Protaetiibacter intestinalis]AYF98406.1 hypothetical protein D7I47_09130 [Protaetiibacter intestinalis]